MESGATWDKLCMYRIFQTIRRMCPPPQICEESGVVSYSPNVAYLACWGWGSSGGAGSQEAGAGSPLQEVGSGRSGMMLHALGWEEGVSLQCKAREEGAESPLRHTIVLGRRVQAVQAH